MARSPAVPACHSAKSRRWGTACFSDWRGRQFSSSWTGAAATFVLLSAGSCRQLSRHTMPNPVTASAITYPPRLDRIDRACCAVAYEATISDRGYRELFGGAFVNATACIFLGRTAALICRIAHGSGQRFHQAQAQGQGAATAPSDARVDELQKQLRHYRSRWKSIKITPISSRPAGRRVRRREVRLNLLRSVPRHRRRRCIPPKKWSSVTRRMHIQMDAAGGRSIRRLNRRWTK